MDRPALPEDVAARTGPAGGRGGGRGVRAYLVALVLVLLLPAWLAAGLAARRLAEADRQAIAADGREAARAIAAATEREIGALHASLVALATSPALAEGDLELFHRQASTLAAALGAQVMLIAPDGRQLVNTALPYGTPLPRAAWSDGLAEGGRAMVSEVYRAPIGGRATVAVSLPVRIPGAETAEGLTDMLSIGADAVRFWSRALRQVALPPGWIAAVHDRGEVILARHPDPERFVGQPVHPDALAVLHAAPPGTAQGWSAGSTSRDGKPVYMAWHRLANAPWTALVGVPGEAVDGLLRRSLLPVAAGGGVVVFGLSLGLALWGTRRIARPLALLERAAAAVGRGEVPAPLRPSGLRELDAVAAALSAAAVERRESEAQGAALAARLEAVLESTTDGVLVVDPDWRVTYANSRARRMLERRSGGGADAGAAAAPAGGPLRPLLRSSLWDAFRPEFGGPFEPAYRRAMRDRLPQGVSGYHPQLGLWISADAFPDGKGGLTIFFRDISAAKLAEEALRDSEARLKAVLEHVPVGVLLAEAPSGRRLLINRQAAGILGRGPAGGGSGGGGGETEGEEAAWEAYDAQCNRIAEADLPLARTLAAGTHEQGEMRLLRPDGTLVWIRAWSAPIRDTAGRMTGAVVAFADIGAERAAAEALRRQVAAETAARQAAISAAEALAESEERFRRFGEASPDGLWIGDPAGRRLDYTNPAFERMWHASRAALAADPGLWLARVHPEDRARAAAAIPQAVSGDAAAPVDIEYRLLLDEEPNGAGNAAAPRGTIRWMRDILFPIRDAAGRVVRLGRLVRDVTPRKEWEERQAMLMGELNHRVKNTLATVQSLARQTARGGGGGGGGVAVAAASEAETGAIRRFLEDFQARLLALARGHDLLTARTWRGASLGEVIAAALAPWRSPERTDAASDGSGEAPRILEAGPDGVWLAPRQALGLALGLHELATNAAKHGALSRRDGGGQVALRWEVPAEPEGLVTLVWREKGGPPVNPPSRRGFGSRLLERGLAAELGRDASVALRYDPQGLQAIIRFRAAAPPGTSAAGRGGEV